jgi:hypothetical protein
MKKIFYVELTKPQYFFLEVEAGTAEEAENAVLAAAPGSPTDWKIVRTDDVSCNKFHRDSAQAA